jgi:hypothetical protein
MPLSVWQVFFYKKAGLLALLRTVKKINNASTSALTPLTVVQHKASLNH